MIESYLLGLATGFFMGVAAVVIPEKIRQLLAIRKDSYVDISSRH